ncbi:hypothetical protein ETAA8_09480 [Anatilimnocola aggregata]|uniref:Uncharacterized protein n=1 Tax=Anatilimnocola aggregata TaxID=2528021 RepID=A0A517Y6N4_9BACT|nr:hypothetical protein [Anatilimnocola aggregata]QDU25876.1 hypothetical protein ETAA8_09480 [Anatilimnocola aggregata]
MSKQKRYGENSKQVALKLDGEMHERLVAMQTSMAQQGVFVELSSLIRSAIAKYLKNRLVILEEPNEQP